MLAILVLCRVYPCRVSGWIINSAKAKCENNTAYEEIEQQRLSDTKNSIGCHPERSEGSGLGIIETLRLRLRPRPELAEGMTEGCSIFACHCEAFEKGCGNLLLADRRDCLANAPNDNGSMPDLAN